MVARRAPMPSDADERVQVWGRGRPTKSRKLLDEWGRAAPGRTQVGEETGTELGAPALGAAAAAAGRCRRRRRCCRRLAHGGAVPHACACAGPHDASTRSDQPSASCRASVGSCCTPDCTTRGRSTSPCGWEGWRGAGQPTAVRRGQCGRRALAPTPSRARAAPCPAPPTRLHEAQQARHLVHVQAVVLCEGPQQLAAQLVVQQHHAGAVGHSGGQVEAGGRAGRAAGAALLGQAQQVLQAVPLEAPVLEQHLCCGWGGGGVEGWGGGGVEGWGGGLRRVGGGGREREGEREGLGAGPAKVHTWRQGGGGSPGVSRCVRCATRAAPETGGSSAPGPRRSAAAARRTGRRPAAQHSTARGAGRRGVRRGVRHGATGRGGCGAAHRQGRERHGAGQAGGAAGLADLEKMEGGVEGQADALLRGAGGGEAGGGVWAEARQRGSTAPAPAPAGAPATRPLHCRPHLGQQRADDQGIALGDADGILVHQLVELARHGPVCTVRYRGGRAEGQGGETGGTAAPHARAALAPARGSAAMHTQTHSTPQYPPT